MTFSRAGVVGLVINPTSGQGEGARSGRRVRTLLEELGHEVINLSATNLLTATANARQAVIDGIRALVVVGGDGMVHLGVNAVAGTGVPLGVVAVGSGDDFARSVNLPVHKPAEAVAIIDRALAENRNCTVDAVRVSNPDTLDGRWYAGVLSAGLDAAVNARANRIAFPKGRLKYVRAVAGELSAFLPYGYRVTTDDGVWESEGTLVAVANTPMFGGGIKIAPNAAFDDGILDVVIAGPLSRMQAARLFPGTYRGSHLKHPAVQVLRSRTVLLEATGRGQRPPHAFADGEEIGPLPLLLEVHAGALHLLL